MPFLFTIILKDKIPLEIYVAKERVYLLRYEQRDHHYLLRKLIHER